MNLAKAALLRLLCVGTVWLVPSCGSQGQLTGAALEPGQRSPRIDLVLQLKPGMTWTARLVNRGEGAVEVVLPGDGSSDGWRTPIVRWTVVAEGESFAQLGGRRCGNINALQSDEVVTLRGGESVSIDRYGLFRPRLPESGSVSVSLSYENIPQLEWQGIALGPHDSASMSRVRASAPLSLTSNLVQFEIPSDGE